MHIHHNSTSPQWGNCSIHVSTLLLVVLPRLSVCEEQGKDSLNPILAENDMPKELHNSPALRVTLLSIHNPIPEMLIVT